MYFEIEDALQELARRQDNPTIETAVLKFLGTLPEGFPRGRIGCIPRHIASCRYEDLAFATLCRNAGLAPWWPTYTNDYFTTTNPDKVSFVYLKVDIPHHVVKKKLVGNIERLSKAKTRLRDIEVTPPGLVNGPMNLPEFHRALRQAILPKCADNWFDISDWLHQQARRHGWEGDRSTLARSYYPATLAPYITHAILFEDFHSGPNATNLDWFRIAVLEPALEVLQEKIGFTPLIVRLPWQRHYGYYPEQILELSWFNGSL